jgi:hypothetical protein
MPAIDIPSAARIQVARYRVKYKDIFDLKEFYKGLHFWLEEREWTDHEEGSDHYENLYLEKIDMAGFKEMWMKWRPQRIPVKNSYYRYWIDFDFHCLSIKPTEVVKEGKKFKVVKGEVELFVTAWIELDYQGQWSSHPILRYFNKLFPNRIFRRALFEEHKRELYREVYELQNWIKRWFKLKRFLPYEETKTFHPSYAWPSHKNE